MGQLFNKIKEAVAAEEYAIGQHANERLRQRGIPGWQVISGLDDGILILERPDAGPNPTVEVQLTLPDGTPVKAVWSWLKRSKSAKLVTVHFFGDQ